MGKKLLVRESMPGKTWVAPTVKKDGVKVRGYWRTSKNQRQVVKLKIEKGKPLIEGIVDELMLKIKSELVAKISSI